MTHSDQPTTAKDRASFMKTEMEHEDINNLFAQYRAAEIATSALIKRYLKYTSLDEAAKENLLRSTIAFSAFVPLSYIEILANNESYTDCSQAECEQLDKLLGDGYNQVWPGAIQAGGFNAKPANNAAIYAIRHPQLAQQIFAMLALEQPIDGKTNPAHRLINKFFTSTDGDARARVLHQIKQYCTKHSWSNRYLKYKTVDETAKATMFGLLAVTAGYVCQSSALSAAKAVLAHGGMHAIAYFALLSLTMSIIALAATIVFSCMVIAGIKHLWDFKNSAEHQSAIVLEKFHNQITERGLVSQESLTKAADGSDRLSSHSSFVLATHGMTGPDGQRIPVMVDGISPEPQPGPQAEGAVDLSASGDTADTDIEMEYDDKMDYSRDGLSSVYDDYDYGSDSSSGPGF